MKSSIFRGLVCASILVFAIGCGKDNKSGGGAAPAPYNPVVNPVINPVINPGANIDQVAFANLKAWYENPAETNSVPLGASGSFTKETKLIPTGNGFSFQGSLCIGSWGINCGNQNTSPTHCFLRSTDNVNYHLGTPSGYTCNVTQSNVTKYTNTELSNAVNGAGLALIDVQQHGSVFYVVFGAANAYQQSAQVIYTINTAYHSLLNPVTIENRSTGQITINKNLQTSGI